MKKQILFGLLAAGMLAACSSDDSLSENTQYNLVEGQPAFISVSLMMPDVPSTRANDDFNDGVAGEYKVNDGKLVLFKGADETSATLLEACDIPTLTWEADGNNQITTSAKNFVQEITAPNLGPSDNLYAYVILNAAGNATNIAYTSGMTYTAFSLQVLKAIGIKAAEADGYGSTISDGGLVMTSVAAATAAGGTAAPAAGTKVTSLAPIDPESVKPTAEEAKTAAAACIYVERAAVKIDVTFSDAIADPAGSSAKVALVGWALGNTNNNESGYYNVRQVNTAWFPYFNENATTAATTYRFVCATPFAPQKPTTTGHNTLYRTYFGQDVNYNSNTGLIHGTVTDAEYTLASGACTYTYENTFDENSQIYANTTYVGFKTTLNDGADFYTIEKARNTALDLANLKTALANNIGTAKSADINELVNAISAAISTDLSSSTSTIIAAEGTITPSTKIDFKLAHNITLNGGVALTASSADVSYADQLSFSTINIGGTEVSTAVKTAINALSVTIGGTTTTVEGAVAGLLSGVTPDKVAYYKGGVAYYATRIAHFGNNETPWDAPSEAYNDYDKIYPSNGQTSLTAPKDNYGVSRAAAWLGRWGIVRNNWYSLTVSNITGIGDAVPVDYSGTASGEPGLTPDDNPDPKYYVSAHIHILPWVKRVQDVILK